jgi:hypothetical protein
MTIHAARYFGAFGPVFLIMLPVSLLSLATGKRPLLWMLLLFTASYGLLWASPLSSFQMRFLVPIVPFVAIIAAAGYAHLEHVTRALPGGMNKIAFLFLCLLMIGNFPPFIPLHETDRVVWKGWLTHVLRETPAGGVLGTESEDAYLTRTVSSYRAWQYIDSVLGVDATVLTFSDGDHYYSRTQRLWNEAALADAAVYGALRGDEQKALSALDSLRITHILFDKRFATVERYARLALFSPAFNRWLEWTYEDERYVLYRIRFDELSPMGNQLQPSRQASSL